MKLQSMTDFVLQGMDEVATEKTLLERPVIIYKYAIFLQTELKPEQFDPKNPEALFESFTVDAETWSNSKIVVERLKDSFFLGFDMEQNIQFDYSDDDLCVPTIESLIAFCDRFGYKDIELTDYATSIFL